MTYITYIKRFYCRTNRLEGNNTNQQSLIIAERQDCFGASTVKVKYVIVMTTICHGHLVQEKKINIWICLVCPKRWLYTTTLLWCSYSHSKFGQRSNHQVLCSSDGSLFYKKKMFFRPRRRNSRKPPEAEKGNLRSSQRAAKVSVFVLNWLPFCLCVHYFFEIFE